MKKEKTILLVEDEILIRIAMAEDLTAAGFEIWQAAHADEALKVLETVAVDVIITDIRMPSGSMDGLALAKVAHERWPETKTVILSSHMLSGEDRTAVDLCLTKPGDMTKITDHVHKLLGNAA